MSEDKNTFKYKLDFYYQQSLIYLLTFIIYTGARGTMSESGLKVVLHDPVLYIITIFVLISLLILVLNYIRDRKLVIGKKEFIFHSRFHEIIIPFSEIESMHVGLERLIQTSGRFQVIVIKLKQRRRTLRIRVGRYEREKELISEMQRIAAKFPSLKMRRFRMR